MACSRFIKIKNILQDETKSKFNIKNNQLLDQQETDLRFTYEEIIGGFPCAEEQKKMIEISSIARNVKFKTEK